MIQIDEQFRTLIPPLTDDEYNRLKENILAEGIRDKLVVWNDTLIDGHNRYRIATENDLPYETVDMEFEDRDHALNWIISNQLGRRNLNPSQIAYLRGKRYETEKKISTDNLKIGNIPPMYQIDTSAKTPRTRDLLAKEYGVGEATITRNARFAQVVDILPQEAKREVLSGCEIISQSTTDTIARMDKPTQNKFVKEVESGTPIKEAVKKLDPEQKRKAEDDKLRADIERQRVMRERTKFDPWTSRQNDAIVCGKTTFIENIDAISNKAEIWIIGDIDKAEEAKQILRKYLNFKFS